MTQEKVTAVGALVAITPPILLMLWLIVDGMIESWRAAIRHRHFDPFHFKMMFYVTLGILTMFIGVGIMFYAALSTRT